jgi:hypothetical protein
MPRRMMHGNDLTSHEVYQYDLDELHNANCAAHAVEQFIGAIEGHASIFHSFHVAQGEEPSDAQEDSTASLSLNIRGKVRRLREFMTNPAESDLAIIAAITIGQLSDRLRWMWLHSDPARKGHRRLAHEKLAQQRGAAANKRKAHAAVAMAARLLKEQAPADQLTALPDSALARQLSDADLGGKRSERTVRNYVALARRRRLLPPRSEM